MRYLMLVTAALLGVLVGSCSGDQQLEAYFSGVVSDADGSALENVQVQIFSSTNSEVAFARTDSNGRFEVRTPLVSGETYTIALNLTDFDESRNNIQLIEGNNVHSFQLQRSCSMALEIARNINCTENSRQTVNLSNRCIDKRKFQITQSNDSWLSVVPKSGDIAGQNSISLTLSCSSAQQGETAELTITTGNLSTQLTATFRLDETAPLAPTSMRVVHQTTTSVDLVWIDVVGEDGYRLERSDQSTDSGFVFVTELNADQTTYTDTGLSPSTSYLYRLIAFNSAGENISIPLTAQTRSVNPVLSPTGFSAQARSASEISLSWQDIAQDEQGYYLDRSVDNSSFSRVAELPMNAISHVDKDGISSSITYYYRLQAFRGADKSPFVKAQVTTPTAPIVAPKNLRVLERTETSVSLAWDDVLAEDGYRIERSTQSPTSGFSVVGNLSANKTAFTDTALTPGTTYYYKITSYNGSGQKSSSPETAVTRSEVLPLTAPTGFSARVQSSTEISLSWQDRANDEQGYYLERRTSGTSFTTIAQLGANSTSYVNTGLSSSTTYIYRLRAYRGTETSEAATTEATTQRRQVELQVRVNGSGRVTVQGQSSSCSSSCRYTVDEDSRVTLSARANSGSTFVRWTGCSSSNTSCNVTMSRDRVVEATFQSVGILRLRNNTNYYVLSLRLNGTEMLTRPLPYLESINIPVTNTGSFTANTQMGPSVGTVYFSSRDPVVIAAGRTTPLTLPLPSIGQMMADFQSNGRAFFGSYLDLFFVRHNVSFGFNVNSNWVWYRNGILSSSGSLQVVSWLPYGRRIEFRLCPTCGSITINEPFTQFTVGASGDLPVITYTAP